MEDTIQTMPENKPSQGKRWGVIAGLVVGLAVIAGAVYYYGFSGVSEDELPPSLTVEESTYGGFLQKGITVDQIGTSYEFTSFSAEDMTAFENRLKNEFVPNTVPFVELKTTAANQGIHYLYSEKDTNVEEILKAIDPSAQAVAIAKYNNSIKNFQITPNTYPPYQKAIQVDLAKAKDVKIAKGEVFLVIAFKDTRIYGYKDGTKFADAEFDICAQTDGWYNFAIPASYQHNINGLFENCYEKLQLVWIQDNVDPDEFELAYKNTSSGTTPVQDLLDYEIINSLMWVRVGAGAKDVVYPPKDDDMDAPEKLPAPQNFKVSVGDSLLELTWAKVDNAESYTASCVNKTNSDEFTTQKNIKELKYSITNATNGKTYECRVVAVDKDGKDGTPSAAIEGTPTAAETPATEPGTVTPGTVTPGTVTPGTVTPGTVTPGTVTPGTTTPTVDPGTIGPGAIIPGGVIPGTTTPETTLSTPSSVTGLAIIGYEKWTGDNSSVLLTWAVPPEAEKVTGYKINALDSTPSAYELKEFNPSSGATAPSTPYFVIFKEQKEHRALIYNLDLGLAYIFNVVAVNAQGDSKANVTYEPITLPPSKITGLKLGAIDANKKTISFSWDLPSEGERDNITEYRIYDTAVVGLGKQDIKKTYTVPNKGTATAVIENFQYDGFTHYFKITAVNSSSESELSELVSFEPAQYGISTIIQKIINLSAFAAEDGVIISWETTRPENLKDVVVEVRYEGPRTDKTSDQGFTYSDDTHHTYSFKPEVKIFKGGEFSIPLENILQITGINPPDIYTEQYSVKVTKVRSKDILESTYNRVTIRAKDQQGNEVILNGDITNKTL